MLLFFFVLRFDISPPFGTWWVPIRKKKNGDDHIAVGKRTEAPSEELGTRRRSFCHLFSAVVNFFIVVRYFPFGFVWFPRRNAPLLIKGKWHHLLKWHLLQFNGLYPFQPLWLVFHLLVVPSFMDFDNSFFSNSISKSEKKTFVQPAYPFIYWVTPVKILLALINHVFFWLKLFWGSNFIVYHRMVIEFHIGLVWHLHCDAPLPTEWKCTSFFPAPVFFLQISPQLFLPRFSKHFLKVHLNERVPRIQDQIFIAAQPHTTLFPGHNRFMVINRTEISGSSYSIPFTIRFYRIFIGFLLEWEAV